MRNEAKTWLIFAEENLKSSEVLLESSLFNPSLQNAQQSIEKAFKACLIQNEIPFIKTHDIYELNLLLKRNNIHIDISEEECDLINSIYLPSKYPLGSAIPDFVPDMEICNKVIEISKRVYSDISYRLSR